MASKSMKQAIKSGWKKGGKVASGISAAGASVSLVINHTVMQAHVKACIDRAQKVVDSEVLRYCDPLVPFQTGNLKRSGQLGTTIGSGTVCYIAPYAKFQYYCTSETRPYAPNRGAKWFERMKTAYKKDIERAAQAALSGKIG